MPLHWFLQWADQLVLRTYQVMDTDWTHLSLNPYPGLSPPAFQDGTKEGNACVMESQNWHRPLAKGERKTLLCVAPPCRLFRSCGLQSVRGCGGSGSVRRHTLHPGQQPHPKLVRAAPTRSECCRVLPKAKKGRGGRRPSGPGCECVWVPTQACGRRKVALSTG